MPAFFTAAHLRLSLLLAVLGGLIALIFTIFSDSGVVALIFRPIVSALIMFVLGTMIYALLANKVPEAIDVIENKPEELSGEGFNPEGAMTEGEMGEGAGAGDMSEMSMDGSDGGSAAYDSGASGGSMADSNIPRKTGVQISKDEVVVNGVKFKNQPEVMAETIKQLMDQDKD